MRAESAGYAGTTPRERACPRAANRCAASPPHRRPSLRARQGAPSDEKARLTQHRTRPSSQQSRACSRGPARGRKKGELGEGRVEGREGTEPRQADLRGDRGIHSQRAAPKPSNIGSAMERTRWAATRAPRRRARARRRCARSPWGQRPLRIGRRQRVHAKRGILSSSARRKKETKRRRTILNQVLDDEERSTHGAKRERWAAAAPPLPPGAALRGGHPPPPP
jgi:hypothetical protein